MKEYSIERIPHKVWGRTGKSHSPLALFWTGAALELNIRGAEAWIEVETDYDTYEVWIDILVDEAVTQRIMLPKGRSRVCCFRGMNPKESKNVRIIRDTPAMTEKNDKSNILMIRSVLTDGEIEPVLNRMIRIEFIGDSITCGEGCGGAVDQMDWNSACFSAIDSYPFYIAQALDAEYNVIAQSGWGVVFSYEGKKEEAIPSCYGQICGLTGGDRARRMGAKQPWDFTSWQPDIIIINLGTNDAQAIEDAGFNARQTRMRKDFAAGIVSFLKELRAMNPNAQIIWAYGMLGDQMADEIRDSMNLYYQETGDDKVMFFLLEDTPTEDFGSREHPGPQAHRRAAEDICDLLEEM